MMENKKFDRKLLTEELAAITGGLEPGDLPGNVIEEGDEHAQCPNCGSMNICHYVWKIGPFGRSKHVTGVCDTCERGINYTLVYNQ